MQCCNKCKSSRSNNKPENRASFKFNCCPGTKTEAMEYEEEIQFKEFEKKWADHALFHDPTGWDPKKFRYCDREELYRLDPRKAKLKNLISCVFAVLALFFLIITIQDTDENFVEEKIQCRVTSSSEFENTVSFLSPIFLGPFIAERFSLFAVTFLSHLDRKVSIPLSNGTYVGVGWMLNEVLTGFFLARLVNGIVFFWNAQKHLPYDVLGKRKVYTEFIKAFFFYAVGDFLLCGSLLVLSFFLIIIQDSAEGIFVNFVALQGLVVFSDDFIRRAFFSRRTLGSTLENFVWDNPEATIPVYYPLRELRRLKRQTYKGFQDANLNKLIAA
eukprot:maker-scaffold_1-snap-gene-0.7-mRNA-1 protein AED:0.00 eAED:0.00 QI:410/1/1/1/1/1/2/20/328